MTTIDKTADFGNNNVTSNGTSSYNSNGIADNKQKFLYEQAIGDQTSIGATSEASTATSDFSTKSSIINENNSACETLKIIGHIKNIEKINEKRRVFLSNTLGESISSSTATSNDKSETVKTSTSTTTTTKTTAHEKCETKIDNGNQGKQNDVVQINNEEHSIVHETSIVDKANNGDKGIKRVITSTTHLPPLKSPLSPPPKPPMLSRTRSLGVGDQRSMPVNVSETPQTPANTPTSPVCSPTKSPNTTPITSATITTINMASPTKVATVTLRDESPIIRRTERPTSVTPETICTAKNISVNHYERLIEELKCPGCAAPMKAPILLCQTGHSVCNQCTRVLMMCPLCKEPFTNLRSRTVEALCAKAHFRCCNASGGCSVRLQTDLLSWHEKQCIFKPMKCFMGRVWGDCQWTGREAHWKDHLEEAHTNRLFKVHSADLIWNMGVKQKPLTGYYVFDIYDELFNFYEIYDRDRVLFTMTCTSTQRDRKHNFAFEVTIVHEDNEALAITQKFPVHSEYDKDILAEGTCVSIPLNDLAKFIDDEKLLHYHVRLLEVKTPKKTKPPRYIIASNNTMHPVDFQQTQIEGVNLKGVPNESIVTRKVEEIPFVDNTQSPSSYGTEIEAGAIGLDDEDIKMRRSNGNGIRRDSNSDSDPEFEAYIAKRWGTPQLHFNRKYLKTASTESTGSAGDRRSDYMDRTDDKMSISSRNTSYAKRVTNTIRKSFRSLKTPIVELKPLSFGKKSPEKKSP